MASADDDGSAFMDALEAAVRSIESDADGAADEAISSLGLLLEMNARPVDALSASRFYEDMIPSDLRALQLDGETERALARRLLNEFRVLRKRGAYKRAGSVLWALGKASPWNGFEPIVEALGEDNLTESETFQGLNALANMLYPDSAHPRFGELRALVRNSNLIERLKSIADRAWEDNRIARDAKVALQLVEPYLN